MKFKRLEIEKLILNMYILINLYFGILILINKEYYSEFKFFPVQLEKFEVIIILLINILSFVSLYKIYKKISKKKLQLKNYKIILNKNKLNWIFFFITIIQIFFYLNTGIGKVGQSRSNNFSFIFNILNLDSFFLIYYVIARQNRRIFKLNVLLYIIFYLMRGWSGILFQIFIIEIYFQLKKRKILDLSFIYNIIILAIGGKIYQYLYSLKIFIRTNTVEKLNYLEGINKLLERLSVINHSLIGIQNLNKIKELYIKQGIYYTEIKGFFRPFLPNFLFPEGKDFRVLNNIIMQSVYSDISKNTSSGMGIFSYGYNIFNISIIEFFFWILFFLMINILYILIIKFLIIATRKKELNILLFLWFVDFGLSGSLEMNNYGWPRIIIFLFLLYIFGVLKIYKRRKFKI